MRTITDIQAEYTTGTKPIDVMTQYLDVIKDKNDDINALLDVYQNEAMAAAANASGQLAAEQPVPLAGVPIVIKNNIMYADHRVTAASKMLEHYTATYSATIVDRLKAAGAIIIGAANLDEFAMGSSTENSAFGVTKNPHDTTRVPGGTSGGSAAAVAAGMVPAAIGTDTGGSVRQPASYCGLVGYKPTYGAVSRYGLLAMGSSLDQAGPLTHTVADAELLHNIMSGHDPLDGTTIQLDTYPEVSAKDSYTIGVPRSFLTNGVDPDVLTAFEAQLESLRSAGHSVVDIDLPLFENGLAAYYIVMPAEVSSNLARYDGMRYGLSVDSDVIADIYKDTRAAGFGAEVKRRILLGTYVLSSGYYDAYYTKAEQLRTLMRQELDRTFQSVDIIATPTAPTPAFRIGEQSDPLSMYRQDIFTVPVNLTGVPALSVPMGTVDRSGVSLPVGVQYIGPHAGDARLFAFGKATYDSQIHPGQ